MKKIILIAFFTHIKSLGAFQSVDINQASVGQIAELPSVGAKLAKDIVSFRQKNGLFSQESDLLLVPGLKPAKLKKISGKIVFGRSGSRKQVAKAPPVQVQPTTTLSPKPIIALASLEKIVIDSMSLSEDLEAAMVSRARRSAMLPKVTLLFDFDRDIDLSEKKVTNGADTILKHGGRDLGFGIRAAFDLSELVFHKTELEVASLALKRLEKREKILDRLYQQYVRYGHLQEAGQVPNSLPAIQKIASELKEVALILDSMSKGAFSHYQQEAQS